MSVFISDPYAIVQTAGETYIGNDTDQVYSINPNLIEPGDLVTIVDQGGFNAIELNADLEITQSMVTNIELLLTLSNGVQINVRGADTFTFNVGQNQAGGDTVGTEKTFADFARDILGVTLPAEGEGSEEGGSSTINDDGTADVNPDDDPGDPVTQTLDIGSYDGNDINWEYLDAGQGSFLFTDDASVETFVVISNFSSDDQIQISNIPEGASYMFTPNGNDVDIIYNYNDEGLINHIKLIGVGSAADIYEDEAGFEAAIGFNAVT
jgi:hypothetical protein